MGALCCIDLFWPRHSHISFKSTGREIVLLLAVWDVISQKQRVSVIGLLTALQGLAEHDKRNDTDLCLAGLLAALGWFLRANGGTELHLDNVSQFLEILPSLNAHALRGLLSRVDGRPPPEYVLQDDNRNPPPEDMSAVISSISSSASVRDVAMLQPL
jgi:hypothetical protein